MKKSGCLIICSSLAWRETCGQWHVRAKLFVTWLLLFPWLSTESGPFQSTIYKLVLLVETLQLVTLMHLHNLDLPFSGKMV